MNSLTPQPPRPLHVGEGDSTVFYEGIGENHGVKAPRPRTGEGLG